MPNNISNHFIISALADGVTIQGSLRVSGTLSQNYNPNINKCIPDWKASASLRPTVYAVIRRGAAYVTNEQIVSPVWLYNDVEIQWDKDNKSSNCLDKDNAPLFQRSAMSVSLGGATYVVPCVTIISNLASHSNIDLDTIGFKGSVEVSGKQATFAAQVDVKIAQMTTQGFIGIVSPESAIISEKNQTVELRASLFAEDGSLLTKFYPKWFLNNGNEDIASSRGQTSIIINEADVTDNMMVRCDFYTDSAYTSRVATAFASIDDTQDPEFLYISFDGVNSDYNGQLAPGDSCEVSMWVATMDDNTAINSAYSNFDIRFYDSAGEEITENTPPVSVNNSVGSVTISYDFVSAHKGQITGIVSAS